MDTGAENLERSMIEPNDVAANKEGINIFRNLRRLQAQVDTIETEHNRTKDELAKMKKTLEEIQAEVAVLQPLKLQAMGIWKSVFETWFRDREETPEISKKKFFPAIINSGNAIAHEGNIIADRHMCQDDNADDRYVGYFRLLYGVDLATVEILERKQLIYVSM